MKKVFSLFLVAIMLISCSVLVFAEQDGTKFVSNKDRNILTEDGRLFYWYPYGSTLELIDAEHIANTFVEIDMEKKKVIKSDGSIYDSYILTEDNHLYVTLGNGRYALICDNVLEFYVNEKYKLIYRDSNYNLYCDNEFILENCSDAYYVGRIELPSWAMTNDGKWYHWGYNGDKELEPIKMVDGIDISPTWIEKPMLATEYILQLKWRDKKITWALDNALYFNDEKLLENVIDFNMGESEFFFINKEGDVAVIDRNYNNASVLDANFISYNLANGKRKMCGINKDGNFSFVDTKDGFTLKTIYANYKYLNRSDWADAEIALADKIGYIDSVKLFDMQSNIKREDFCNMIVDFCEKYLGKELSKTGNPFKDTENEKVIKAYANGIITGVSSNEFAPNNEITREQMCAIMTRASKFLKPDVQFGEGIKFSDMAQVSDWAVEGVNAMSGLGIVKGDGVSITPKSNTSVEQAIAMTYRLYNKIK